MFNHLRGQMFNAYSIHTATCIVFDEVRTFPATF